MKEIKYPENKTWYICWDKERTKIILYNYIMPDQVLTTSHEVLDTYTEESKWLKVLSDNGIDTKNNVNG